MKTHFPFLRSEVMTLFEGRRPKQSYRLSVAIFFFLQGLIFATWASRIPDIKAHLHLNDAILGTLLLALPIGQMLAMSLSGYLIERFSSRRVLPIAIFFYPLILVLIGLSNSITSLALCLVAMGMTSNLHNIAINTQAVGVEYLYRRSIMGTFHGLWSLAGFVAGLTGTLMVSLNLSPLMHFIYVGLFYWICAYFFRPFTLPRDVSVAQITPKEPRSRNSLMLFKGMTREIALIGFLASACMICEGTMYDWSSVYFNDVVRAPKELVRMGYTLCMCCMASGRFFADRLVTRFGPVRVARTCSILIFSGMILMVSFPNVWVASLACMIVGFGISSIVPICYSLAGKSSSMSPSRALTAVSTIGFFGFLIGPPMIGYISKLFGLQIAFLGIALLGLSTSILAGKLKNI